jgi:signal transduction histidine kinase
VLDSHAQGVVFYLIEEAVNNARKYAQAKMINVLVGRKSTDVIMIKIADNGIGFDMGAVNANYDQRGSFGMVNMRERAELLDGTLSVESAPGRGTAITVLIPIPESRADNAGLDSQTMSQTKLGATVRVNGTTRGR